MYRIEAVPLEKNSNPEAGNQACYALNVPFRNIVEPL